MNITQRVVILSAELPNKSYVINRLRTDKLREVLTYKSIAFNEALGHCRGTEETSFVCLVRDNTQLRLLKEYAFDVFNQESILIQDANGISRLEYESGRTRLLGRLKEYPIDQQEYRQNYTILNNRLWAV